MENGGLITCSFNCYGKTYLVKCELLDNQIVNKLPGEDIASNTQNDETISVSHSHVMTRSQLRRPSYLDLNEKSPKSQIIIENISTKNKKRKLVVSQNFEPDNSKQKNPNINSDYMTQTGTSNPIEPIDVDEQIY